MTYFIIKEGKACGVSIHASKRGGRSGGGGRVIRDGVGLRKKQPKIIGVLENEKIRNKGREHYRWVTEEEEKATEFEK